jgi:hypothetical protein
MMRKSLSILLVFLLCVNICGCHEEAPKIQKPVLFYYRTHTPDNNIPDKIIEAVVVEGAELPNERIDILNEYLRRAIPEGCDVTFPAASRVMDLTMTAHVANIELNAAFVKLTGIDLTIACACITMTTMELTGAKEVRITAGSALLDGAKQIVMDDRCLNLLENTGSEPTE